MCCNASNCFSGLNHALDVNQILQSFKQFFIDVFAQFFLNILRQERPTLFRNRTQIITRTKNVHDCIIANFIFFQVLLHLFVVHFLFKSIHIEFLRVILQIVLFKLVFIQELLLHWVNAVLPVIELHNLPIMISNRIIVLHH